jgi:hypothetical protein
VSDGDLMAAIDNPALQEVRGWDLRGWCYRAAPGSVCFLYADATGRPAEAVIAVHAPPRRREQLARAVADFPLPAQLVLLGADDGKRPRGRAARRASPRPGADAVPG